MPKFFSPTVESFGFSAIVKVSGQPFAGCPPVPHRVPKVGLLLGFLVGVPIGFPTGFPISSQ